ncbi:MAG: hypothetical protein HC837_01700 [Chloroflexaceae bacterium]|nr:hypothetical protein [Chloroflexaceae bacterium]
MNHRYIGTYYRQIYQQPSATARSTQPCMLEKRREAREYITGVQKYNRYSENNAVSSLSGMAKQEAVSKTDRGLSRLFPDASKNVIR